MTIDAYRTAAEIASDMAPLPTPPAAGLVRVNGSVCTCAPPGRVWCWWYDIQLGDRWRCKHGGQWVRWRDAASFARWAPGTVLQQGWQMGDAHPMVESLAALGWTRHGLKGETTRSLWKPPTPPISDSRSGE